jgi:hypothetical protein
MGGHWLVRFASVVVMACVYVTFAPAQGVGLTKDDRIAKAGVLRLSDFGPGWRQTPSEDNFDEVQDAASDVPECKTYLKIRRESHSVPRRESQTFSQGENVLRNDVVVYPTEARARRALQQFRSPSVANCLRQLYPKLLAKALSESSPAQAGQIESVDADIGLQSVTPRGDEAASYSATITVVAKSGLRDHAYFEDEIVRVGRAITDFSIRNDQGEFPLSDEHASVIDASLARLQAAS